MDLLDTKKSLILLILLFNQALQAQQNCSSYLVNDLIDNTESKTPSKGEISNDGSLTDIHQNTKTELQGESLLNVFKNALHLAMSSPTAQPTALELKKLKSPSKLMTVLKKAHQNSPSTIEFVLWLSLESRIFNNPGDENQNLVQKAEELYDIFLDDFMRRELDLNYPIVSSGKFGSAEAKIKLAKKLKQLEVLFSAIHGIPVNLFEESGWLTVFGITDLGELTSKINQNSLRNRELYERIKNMLSAETTPNFFYNELVDEFFDVAGPVYINDGRGFLVRHITRPLVEDLIHELRLGASLEKKYLAIIDLLSRFENTKPHRQPLGYVLVFFKAYLETHPNVPGFTTHEKKVRSFNPQAFLNLQGTIARNKMIRAIEDEKYETYLSLSEVLNAKHRELEIKVADLYSRFPQYRSEITKLEDELRAIPAITDFGIDLKEIETRLREVDSSRDSLTEGILEQVELENIHLFQDLNYRWERLLPMKAYELRGPDYTHVKFTKDVIKHFERNPIIGARFLAALSKSYVPMKSASGLRKLPGLHEDFRDIKLIKAGSKIRIVGRLIGGIIHFFYIYEVDSGYDNKAINQMIEHYNPEKK